MKTMKRRKFGNTGIDVTEVSLGAMNLRMLDDEEKAKDVIARALDLGINLIDTARAYSEQKPDGRLFESEVFVKEVLESRNDIKEPIVVITKGHGYSAQDFDADLYISRDKLGIKGLKKLKIGSTDIKLVYFFHGLTFERFETMKNTGALDYAKRRKEEGYFDFLGFSSHNGHEKVIKEAIESGYFDAIELPYSVFAPGFGTDLRTHGNILKLAHEKGIAIINMKAFGGTAMISKTKIFEKYCDISTQNRLLYCLSSEYISTVDAGCRFVEELEMDVTVAQMPKLSKEKCRELEETARKVNDVTKNTCRECTHCLEKFECPQGLNFPAILALHTNFVLAKAFNGDIEEIKNQYSLLSKNAEECIACGMCRLWCEYKLDIPELLKETHRLLSARL